MRNGTTWLAGERVVLRLFYGCSYRFHLSGDNRRGRYRIKGSVVDGIFYLLFFYGYRFRLFLQNYFCCVSTAYCVLKISSFVGAV